jgi:hypothetical protein
MSIKENPYGNLTNNYDFTKDYWHILSAQLFFVIAFLVSDFHIVCNIAFTRKCLVPIQAAINRALTYRIIIILLLPPHGFRHNLT